jgi:hypothetical protein
VATLLPHHIRYSRRSRQTRHMAMMRRSHRARCTLRTGCANRDGGYIVSARNAGSRNRTGEGIVVVRCGKFHGECGGMAFKD